MRIAIMHDYFDEIGGAEITLLILARALNATIITTNIDFNKIRDMGYGDIKFKSIGRVTNFAHFKLIHAKLRFFACNLRKDFDFFVFGGVASIFSSKRHKTNLWYCFSPERGLYDLRYYLNSKYSPLQIAIGFFIILDKYFAIKMKNIISPSRNVQLRIRKYYNRDSRIIYSPVETSKFKYKKNGDYWLSVGRIDFYKRIEMQINAFRKLKNEQLIIVGDYSKFNKKYFHKLKKNAPKDVKFLGGIFKRQEIVELYSNCRGFISTSKNEDFGMNVVEAMASGKPVIAGNEGGYKETIINGKTGVLIDNIDAEKLAEAIKEVGKKPEKYKDACQKQAKKFDTKIFVDKMKKEIGI